MQDFSLPRMFRTIFVPFGSFMLLGDVDEARRALRCFRAHLADGGQILIPLHLPWLYDVGVEPAPPGEWRLRRVATRPDDAVVRCYENVDFDFDRQLQHVRLRLEVARVGSVEVAEEAEQALRWFTQEEFADLLVAEGFSDVLALKAYDWEPADPDDASFVFAAC